jgi:hypothetical protein
MNKYNELSIREINELEDIRQCAEKGKAILPEHNNNVGAYFVYENHVPVKACYLGCALIGKEGLHDVKYEHNYYKVPYLNWSVLCHRSWMQTGQGYRGFGYSLQNELHDEICKISDEKGFEAADKFVKRIINFNKKRLANAKDKLETSDKI